MKKVMDVENLNYFYKTLYSWVVAKKPSKTASEKQLTAYYLKYVIAWFFFSEIGPAYHRFITWITRYYPFSLLYKGSLLHADAVKANDLMQDMQDVAKRAGIPVYIDNGHWDRYFSVFYGKLEKRGMNKQDAVAKLQDLFQDKYGAVYVQEEKTGFRVLVDSNLV
jgi:hypothetical protein